MRQTIRWEFGDTDFFEDEGNEDGPVSVEGDTDSDVEYSDFEDKGDEI